VAKDVIVGIGEELLLPAEAVHDDPFTKARSRSARTSIVPMNEA